MQICKAKLSMCSDVKFSRWIALFVSISILCACSVSDLTDKEYLDRAKEYLSKNEHNAAAIELKNALQKNSKNAEARFLLGQYHMLKGNVISAVNEVRLARKYGYENDESLFVYLKALFMQGKFDEVLAELADSKVEPGEMSDDIEALRAEALFLTHKRDEALNAVNAALATSPESESLLVMKAVIEISFENFSSAYQVLNSVIKQKPKATRVWQVKGELDFRHEQYVEAETAFQNVMKNDMLDRNSTEILNATLWLAKIDIAKGDYESSKNKINVVKNVAPDHPTANYLMALISYEQKKYQEAIDNIQVALNFAPKHMQVNLLAGAAYFGVGKYEQAMNALSIAIQNAPDNVAARKLLAEANLRVNNPKKAFETLEPVIDEHSNDSELLAKIGEAALKSGDVKKGRQFLRKASQSNPDSAVIRRELARAYLSENRLDKAVAELERIINVNKKDVSSHRMLANIYFRDGKKDKAFLLLRNLEKEMPDSAEPLNELGELYIISGENNEAAVAFQKALRINANYIPAMINVARLHMMSKEIDLANDMLNKVLEIDPEERTALLGLSEVYIKQGKKAKALGVLERLKNRHQNFIPPRVALAQIYMQDGQLLQAETVINEAVVINPSDISVRKVQGMVLLASGNNSKALKVIEQLVADEPSVFHYYQLAQAQRVSKKHENALASLDSALKLDAKNMPSLSLMSQIYLEIGKHDEAMKVYDEILSYQPDSVFALNNLAILSLERDAKKSLRLAQRAYEINQSAPYADTLGWVMLKNGDLEQSLVYLQQAHDAAPENSSISYHLAVALDRSDDIKNAKRLLNKIVSADKDFHEMEDARRLLKTLE